MAIVHRRIFFAKVGQPGPLVRALPRSPSADEVPRHRMGDPYLHRLPQRTL